MYSRVSGAHTVQISGHYNHWVQVCGFVHFQVFYPPPSILAPMLGCGTWASNYAKHLFFVYRNVYLLISGSFRVIPECSGPLYLVTQNGQNCRKICRYVGGVERHVGCWDFYIAGDHVF